MSDEQTQRPEEQPEDLDVTAEEREDVKGGHAIISPRDPASGLPTGKRAHGWIGETEKN
jgi:hypothetical protein